MKVIFDGREVREIVEAFRAYTDPDNTVPYADLVATYTKANSHFNTLLQALAIFKLTAYANCSIWRTAYRILDNLNLDEEPEADPLLDVIVSIELLPESDDLVITLRPFP